MRVSCNHCGAKNELGRIFCSACGKRMRITNSDVDNASAEARAFVWMSLVRPIVVLLLLGLALTALWPRRPFEVAVAESAKAELRSRVAVKVNALVTAARAGQPLTVAFSSDEASHYLQLRQNASGTNGAALSIRIAGGKLFVRNQSFWGPFKIGGKNVGPIRYTQDATCVPEGRIFKPLAGSFGHLPLPGPLRKLVTGPVADAFVLSPAEQAIEKRLIKTTIRDGTIEIAVGP
jgi:hypothetical protein